MKKATNFAKTNKRAVFIVVVALIGVSVLVATHAASTFSSIEAEQGTVAGATKITDSNASAGQAVQFGVASTAGGGTLPPGLTETAPDADPAWKPDGDNPNTGVKDYSKLKACNGGDISQSGTASNPYVIENCDFTGPVNVTGKYVTIRNSRFKSGSGYLLQINDVPNRADYFVGENLDIIGTGNQDACYVTWARNTTIRNSEITNCIDLVKHAGASFEYNWIHDNSYHPGDHSDLMQVQGGMYTDMVLEGNNF